jgi:hypothetical protein
VASSELHQDVAGEGSETIVAIYKDLPEVRCPRTPRAYRTLLVIL